MPVTAVGKIFKPRLREMAAEAAAREALGLALPGVAFEIEARHGDSGLMLKAKVPAASIEAASRELGKLPLGFEVVDG
jgi:fatty-acyl-CoA synthase